MKIRKILNFLFIFSLLGSLTAQPSNSFRNQHKRRVPRPDFSSSEEPFLIIGIRIGKETNGLVTIDFRFNKQILPFSITENSILIDDKPIHLTSLQFSKDGRALRITTNKPSDLFDIRLQGIQSITEDILPEMIFEDAEEDSIYNFRRREWQSFSSSRTI